ncbi:MAG: hypothetical protein ACC650_05715 [Gammaproteobacteria bacterium]
MNNHSNKLLHYALIILLMMAPLRSVLATQLMVCDMKADSLVTAEASVSAKHCQHGIGNDSMSNASVLEVQDDFQIGKQTKSCCSSNSACMSGCHFAISASLFIQPADYSPALLVIDTFDNVSSLLIVRELSPPSRPPLSLYS